MLAPQSAKVDNPSSSIENVASRQYGPLTYPHMEERLVPDLLWYLADDIDHR